MSFPGKLRLLDQVLPRDAQTRLALGATFISFVLKIAAAIASFLLTLVIARRLGAQGSGVFGLASTIMSIAILVSSLAMDLSSVRAVARYVAQDAWPKLRAWTATVTALSAALVGFVATLVLLGSGRIAGLLGGGADLEYAVAALAIAAIGVLFSRLTAAFLRGTRRFLLAGLVDPFLVPAGAAGAIFFLPVSDARGAAEAYAGVSVAVALIGFGLWSVVLGRRGRPRERLNFSKAVVRSLPIYGSLFGGFMTPWVVILSLGYFGSQADVGVYRIPAQFAILLAFVLQAVENAVAPQFAALSMRGELFAVASATRRLTLVIVLVGVCPAIGLMILAEPTLALFGPEFVAGATALRILVAAQIGVLLLGPVGSMLVMTGLDRYLFWHSMAGALLAVLLSITLIPAYKVEGAALAAGVTGFARAVSATIIVWWQRGLFLPLGITRAKKSH